MSFVRKLKTAGKVAIVLGVVAGGLGAAFFVREKLLAKDKKPRAASWGMARRVAAVKLGLARFGSFTRKEVFPGELVPPQTVDIAMKVGGRLTQVTGLLGETIEKGTLIAEVENTDVKSQLKEADAAITVQKAQLARAEVDLAQWERELERKAPLFKKEILPAQEKETLEAKRDAAKAQIDLSRAQIAQAQARVSVLRVQLESTRAYAPWSGRVARRVLYTGAVVQPGAPILTLVETDPIVARFRVPEREAGDVKLGDSVSVIVDALGGEKLTGRVARLSPIVDPASRTLAVEAEVSQGARPVAPGMFVRAQMTLENRDGVTLVPRATLTHAVTEKGETTLFRARLGWKGVAPRVVAREVKVTLGKSTAEDVEILDGIEAGDALIVEGHANLRDGDPIRIVGLAGSEGEPQRQRGADEREEKDAGDGAETDSDAGVGAETGAGTGTEADAGPGRGPGSPEPGPGPTPEADEDAGTVADAGSETGAGSGTGLGWDAGWRTDAGRRPKFEFGKREMEKLKLELEEQIKRLFKIDAGSAPRPFENFPRWKPIVPKPFPRGKPPARRVDLDLE